MKPAFKHRNKDNSIFKDYLIEPKKTMIEKMLSSRLFKSQSSQENKISSKKANVKELLGLLSKKTTIPQNNETEASKPIAPEKIKGGDKENAQIDGLSVRPVNQASKPEFDKLVLEKIETCPPPSTKKTKKRKKKNKAKKLKLKMKRASSLPLPPLQKMNSEPKYPEPPFPKPSHPPYYGEPQMVPGGYYYSYPALYANMPMNYFYPPPHFGYYGMPIQTVPHMNQLEPKSRPPMPALHHHPGSFESEIAQKKIFVDGGKTIEKKIMPEACKLRAKKI